MSVSEDEGSPQVRGANQDMASFWKAALENFHASAPVGNLCSGTYFNRADTVITNHWRDTVARSVKKFNAALRLVLVSQPTGCSQQQKINIDVATWYLLGQA